MGLFVDETPVLDGDHLIDRVGELVAAILDMHRRIAVSRKAAIDIGDSGHFGSREILAGKGGRAAALEEFQADREQLFHFRHDVWQGVEDHPVLGLNH